ncbi:MAG: phosphate ABC transporter ATP-binding protein PstB [Bacteroidota bacterium]|nr:phosphate ABC transporter ATP-binding protein PstB [Bacteroidota bacterium]
MKPILELKNLSVSYTPGKNAVDDVTTDIYPNTITAIMGPSGCGKSTLLRAINRMHDLYPHIRTTGEILLKGKNVLEMDAMKVRRLVGMVFQQPNPFPTMSIYDNVLAGYSLNGIRLKRREKDEIVEQSLKSVALWDEVKDVMSKRGSFLSGGQQQRLCIARTLAMRPEVLLMDEPTSALDPISTNKIEELLLELKKQFTIIVVTHNMSQAARISDNSMFMYLGELIEHGNTTQMFTKPKNKRTEEYLTGVFG